MIYSYKSTLDKTSRTGHTKFIETIVENENLIANLRVWVRVRQPFTVAQYLRYSLAPSHFLFIVRRGNSGASFIEKRYQLTNAA